MRNGHIGSAVVVATIGLGIALLAACSDDSSSSGASSSGSSGASSTSSTSSSSSSSSGGTSGFKNCGTTTNNGNTSSCSQAELDAYGQCPINNCDAELQECFGPGYKTGTFGGACSTYITCSQKCACGDTACQQACGLPDQACQTCIQKYSTCTQAKCPPPACLGTGSSSGTSGSSGAGGKTCAQLQTCCNGIADSAKKTTCLQYYDAVKASGDSACNAVYGTACP